MKIQSFMLSIVLFTVLISGIAMRSLRFACAMLCPARQLLGCVAKHNTQNTKNTQKHKQTFTHKQRNTEHNIKHRLAKKYAMLIITIDIITPTTGFLLIIDICCNHPIDL